MTQINEPYYDTDPANKAYVDKVNGKTVAFVGTKSKNFGIQPEPPYHINDTYMDGNDIYICIKDRELGSFDSSDWKLATTYTNDDVANSKNKVFITQPTPPYTKGDLWTTGPNGELRRCINSRATGSYVESDWENATSYDNTHTIIENGLVTAGTIQVVNGGTVAAGMTGNVSGDKAVRFWAGATSGNKNSAPFRVLQNGSVFMTKANITGGNIQLYSDNVNDLLFKLYLSGYANDIYSAIYAGDISLKHHSGNNQYDAHIGTAFPSIELNYKTANSSVEKGYQVYVNDNTAFMHLLDRKKQSVLDGVLIYRGLNVDTNELSIPRLAAGNIQCGTCTLNSNSDTTVTFRNKFKVAPIVTLTPKVNGTATGACYSGSVVSTSTTGFKAYCLTNRNSSGNITFNWIAIEPVDYQVEYS